MSFLTSKLLYDNHPIALFSGEPTSITDAVNVVGLL